MASLLQRLGSLFSRRSISGHETWLTTAGASGVWVTEETAMAFGAVYAAINVLCSDVAGFPFQVVRTEPNGAKVVEHDHPFAALVGNEPDPDMTEMGYYGSVVWHGNTHGNGYSEIIRDRYLRPVSFRLLDPSKVKPRKTPAGVLYYDVEGTGKLARDIIHVAAPGFDGIEGKSPIRQSRESIGLTMAVERFGASWFGNGLNPQGFLEVDGDLTEDQIAELRKNLEKVHRGPGNGNRLMLLTGGAKYKPSAIPPDDAQFLATRKFQLAEICRIFRVPPTKLMDFDKASYATLEETNLDYYTSSLLPWLRRIETALSKRLFTAAERRTYSIEHDPSYALKGKLIDQANYFKTMREIGVFSVNEIRAKLGHAPTPGGDMHLAPLNSAPMDLVAAATLSDLKGIKAEPTPPAPIPEPRALPAPIADPPHAPKPARINSAPMVESLRSILGALAARVAGDEAGTLREALQVPGGVLPVLGALHDIRSGRAERIALDLAPTLRALALATGREIDPREIGDRIDRESRDAINHAAENPNTLAALGELAETWTETRGPAIVAALGGFE